MLGNLGVKRARGKLQFHAGPVVRFGAGAAAGAGPAHPSAPDLCRSQNSSLPRGSPFLSRSLIAAGLVDRLSLILHPSLAGSSGAGTHPRDGAIRPPSLHAGSVTAERGYLARLPPRVTKRQTWGPISVRS